jgi:demethylmenaquinone methyltransferase/2-methoxy-6-polyprenyl-1,4-benzoquinol methylase
MGSSSRSDIPTVPPERQIQAMFGDIVERYDLLNDVLSLGLDRWWRRVVARTIARSVAEDTLVLDLGCGTGRLGSLLAGGARVVGIDLSHRMLIEARRRAVRTGRAMPLVQGSAFRLPFTDGMFGAAVSGFVLRNLDDLPAAFAELHRVLAPGARVALVDITEPSNGLVRRAFDAYLGRAAPALGALAGKREQYRYLVRSLAHLPRRGGVCDVLRGTGFTRCSARPLTAGTATLFTATKEER